MLNTASSIEATAVSPGHLAICWLGQAGFALKTSSQKIVYIDPYLSDAVELLYGFKRLMPCPITPEEVSADLVISTHEHEDHLDIGPLAVIAKRSQALFAGPIECVKRLRQAGISEHRCLLLEEGRQVTVAGIQVTGVAADHGQLAPDALGVVLDLGGIRVYHTGDTAYRPDLLAAVIDLRPEIVIPCINGRFGNLDAKEAALLVGAVQPKLAVPAHFWMFPEHNGDPGAFLEHCGRLVPGVRALVLKPGKVYTYSSAQGSVE